MASETHVAPRIFSSNFIHFHPPLSTFIQFHPLSCTFIHFHLLSHFHTFTISHFHTFTLKVYQIRYAFVFPLGTATRPSKVCQCTSLLCASVQICKTMKMCSKVMQLQRSVHTKCKIERRLLEAEAGCVT